MRQMVNSNHSDYFQEENELNMERHHKILAVLVTPNLIMSLASRFPCGRQIQPAVYLFDARSQPQVRNANSRYLVSAE